MKKTLYVLLFLILMAPAQAMAENWKLDTAHSNFFFEIRHTYAAVRGQFGAFSGEVIFDPASPEKADSILSSRSIALIPDKENEIRTSGLLISLMKKNIQKLSSDPPKLQREGIINILSTAS